MEKLSSLLQHSIGFGTAEAAVSSLLKLTLGIEPSKSLPDGMIRTPHRVVKAWQEMFEGYSMDPDEILSATFEDEGIAMYKGMVIVQDIPFYSFCEHHVLPFHGTADVAYIPDGEKGTVVGLSKLARLVDCFAKRFQVQERMNAEIANTLQRVLKPKGTMVTLRAEHLCMCARGVRKPGAITITSLPTGVFLDKQEVREEFLLLTGRK